LAFHATIGQAEALEKLLGENGVKLCISIDLPTSWCWNAFQRVGSVKSGATTYQDTDVPPFSGTCELCGGDRGATK